MRRTLLAALLLAAAGGLAGCRGAKPAPPAPPPPRVTVIRPATVPVRDYWTYNGYLETTKSVEVRSKIRGFLATVEFKEGAEVKAGDPLYKIDKLEFETARDKTKAELDKAEAEIKIAEAQVTLAKVDRDLFATGVAKGVQAPPEALKAEALYNVRIAEQKTAVSTRDAAAKALKTAEIQLGYTDIKAKIGGRISRTLVDEGNLIQADTTLMTTIVKVDELYIYFDAPEADLIAYQQSLIASRQKESPAQVIPVEVGVTKEEGYPHFGVIDFRENRVETATGTIRIRGRIPNPETNGERLLFPGLYARVRVPKGDEVPQLAIPEDCLLSGQEGRFVYVVGADGNVEKRLVTVGPVVWKAPPSAPGPAPPSWVAVNPNPQKPAEGQPPAPTRRPIKSVVAITAGLQPDDQIILDGLQQARPGAPVVPEAWNLAPPGEPKK